MSLHPKHSICDSSQFSSPLHHSSQSALRSAPSPDSDTLQDAAHSSEELVPSPASSGSKKDERSPRIHATVINQFFPPDFAATGQLIEELVHQLEPYNIDVNVFTGQPGYAFQTPSAPAVETQGNVTVKRSQIARLWPRRIRGKAINGVLFCIRAGLNLLRACRHTDVLMVTTAPPFLPILGLLAHWVFGIPYVCLIYDLYPDVANELGVLKSESWLSRIWNEMNRYVWSQAQSLVVLSSTMKDRVVRKCPAIAHKVHVIHNWSDPQWIMPLEKHRNWFAWKHHLVEPFTVLYSGNLGRCHDVETLLDAATQLKDEPIQFVIIGSGAKRQQLMEQVEQLSLTNVQFLPYQDRDDLPYSLTACDLALVSVGRGMEGLVAPSKLYSALSSGRPIGVICEESSYLRSLLQEAQCGETFRHGDATGLAEFVRLLQGDRALTERMGQAGRSHLQNNFTPQHCARRYANVLHQAVHQSLAVSPTASFSRRHAHRHQEAWDAPKP
ncbi:MAG: glycosyltransferase family 4 protein [Elainellaceae cyanobacterium]